MKAAETVRTGSPEETEALAEGFSRRLRSGDRVGLVGELGGGKTCFVRGLARGLGCRGFVKSPSFTIVHVYEGGRLPLYHLDLYRLSGADEVEAAGLEEYIYSDGVSVIEWADKFPEIVEDCDYIVKFTHAGDLRRDIEITGPGDGK